MSTPLGKALVIGASNLDIKGHTYSYHVAKTSNPGIVRTTAGGVARNIAENLARMDVPVTLLSVVGEDLYGKQILDITGDAGVDLSRVLVSKDQRTGIFLAILNHYGDLESAIADLDIIKMLTPEYLNRNVSLFDQAKFVVVDADIPTPSLIFCLEQCKKHQLPICVEPISVARAKQIIPFLDQITMVTPNREEAEVLVGFPLRSATDVKNAGLELVHRGIKWAIITLGPEGVLIAHEQDGEATTEFLPSISTVVTDTVGAGDALTSGAVCGLINGLNFRKAVERGVLCATLTLQTTMAVHPDLSLEKLKNFKG